MAAMAAFTFSSCEDVPEPYTQPTQPGAPTTAEAKGTGSAADPFNIAGIIKYIENGGSADQEVYTKGKVVSVKAGSFDASFGSLKYYISDDGTTANQFYVYNGYAGPNRTKFSGEDALKPGDEVVICGKAKNYNGTNEYDTGNYLVSLNGKPTSGSTTPDTPADGYINETFSKSFGSFTAKTIKGTAWVIDSYGYAKATGYDNASKTTTPSESYIVSKAIDLSASKSATLEFSYILRYVTRNGAAVEGVKNQVLITDNYTGDPATTKWEDITGTMKEGVDWTTWETYKHDLSDFKGMMRFDNRLVGAVLDRLGRDVSLIPDGETHFFVSADVVVSPQFFAWVYGFGAMAQIIGPADVVEQMRGQLADVARLYGSE